MKRISQAIVVTVLLLTSTAPAGPEPSVCRAVLLPLDQASVRPAARISEQRFYSMVHAQFSRLTNALLLSPQALAHLVDEALVDDAVFELIVTDSLTRTLARLDGLNSPARRAQEQRRVARASGINYMIKARIMPIRRQWRIAYSIVDTQSGAAVHARSFYEVDNRPYIVAHEIAKRVTRALWQVLNRTQPATP